MKNALMLALTALFVLTPIQRAGAVTEPVMTYAKADLNTMTLTIRGLNLPTNAAVYMAKAEGGAEKLATISASSSTVAARLASSDSGTFLVALVVSPDEFYTTTVVIEEAEVSFLATISSRIDIADATFSKVVFDVVVHDTAGSYDPVTGVFTAPRDGIYHIDATLQYLLDAAAAARVNVYLFKNGSQWVDVFENYHSSTAAPSANRNASVTSFLNAGDTLDVRALINGATGLLERGFDASRLETYFSVFLVN